MCVIVFSISHTHTHTPLTTKKPLKTFQVSAQDLLSLFLVVLQLTWQKLKMFQCTLDIDSWKYVACSETINMKVYKNTVNAKCILTEMEKCTNKKPTNFNNLHE